MKKQTINSIADELGVSRTTLYRWRSEGIDISAKNIIALRLKAGISKAKQSVTEEIQAARLRKLVAEAEAKEHALEVEKGRYILASDAQKYGAQAGVAVRAEFEKLEDSLPPILIGLSSALQMKSQLREYSRRVLLELSDLFQVTHGAPD